MSTRTPAQIRNGLYNMVLLSPITGEPDNDGDTLAVAAGWYRAGGVDLDPHVRQVADLLAQVDWDAPSAGDRVLGILSPLVEQTHQTIESRLGARDSATRKRFEARMEAVMTAEEDEVRRVGVGNYDVGRAMRALIDCFREFGLLGTFNPLLLGGLAGFQQMDLLAQAMRDPARYNQAPSFRSGWPNDGVAPSRVPGTGGVFLVVGILVGFFVIAKIWKGR